MALDFPDTPTVGQIFSSDDISWQWDGTRWVHKTSQAGEVWIGPTAPTDPTQELWYDTDAVSPSPQSAVATGSAQAIAAGPGLTTFGWGTPVLNGVTYSAGTKAFTITKAGQYLFTLWVLANIASIDRARMLLQPGNIPHDAAAIAGTAVLTMMRTFAVNDTLTLQTYNSGAGAGTATIRFELRELL